MRRRDAMPFLQLTPPSAQPILRRIEDALLAAGASSITLEDAGDDPVLEPLPGTTPLWPRVRIKALFDGDADPRCGAAALRATLPQPLPTLASSTLADRAWEREWLKDFRPMRFGRRLWICPGRPASRTLELTARRHRRPCLIELDPGLAFGTGTHPTTALCLEWLDSAAAARQPSSTTAAARAFSPSPR